jgi:hypothetical protein
MTIGQALECQGEQCESEEPSERNLRWLRNDGYHVDDQFSMVCNRGPIPKYVIRGSWPNVNPGLRNPGWWRIRGTLQNSDAICHQNDDNPQWFPMIKSMQGGSTSVVSWSTISSNDLAVSSCNDRSPNDSSCGPQLLAELGPQNPLLSGSSPIFHG